VSTVIQTENLGKRYVISHMRSRSASIRERISDAARTVGKRLKGHRTRRTIKEEFWALQNVNLEVQKGERLGIIGVNGAGKSTLLKTLSRITEPTVGCIRIKGRTSSLLEVGTGFHPELTGRENIYLNGAILGMARADITRRFDEIVAFAEVERFVDTPVKRYSSGMYVRLAFSVAAHLQSEILIVDEVLAVGDVAFQKKCLDRMSYISRESGRTVLLVSHNLSTIAKLSERCILLEKGVIIKMGDPETVVQEYVSGGLMSAEGSVDLSAVKRYGSGRVKFTSAKIWFEDESGHRLPFAVTGCDLVVETELQANENVANFGVAMIIYDSIGNRIIDANTIIKGIPIDVKKNGARRVIFRVKKALLKSGHYSLGLWTGRLNDEDYDGISSALSFSVEPRKQDTSFSSAFPGVYVCDFGVELL
jgi:lipopolysaccharide transport system ATP-binding protein